EQQRLSQVSLFDTVPVATGLPTVAEMEPPPDPPTATAAFAPAPSNQPETPPPSGVSRIQGRRTARSSYLKRR
ncbi:UNVERIFIED_ORG: hypothetical protein ABIC72_006620, partial [Burkholderia sp. 1988]|nr:hypothetical protein [Paraburkholderia terricola]